MTVAAGALAGLAPREKPFVGGAELGDGVVGAGLSLFSLLGAAGGGFDPVVGEPEGSPVGGVVTTCWTNGSLRLNAPKNEILSEVEGAPTAETGVGVPVDDPAGAVIVGDDSLATGAALSPPPEPPSSFGSWIARRSRRTIPPVRVHDGAPAAVAPDDVPVSAGVGGVGGAMGES
jgi:hypothetical protein